MPKLQDTTKIPYVSLPSLDTEEDEEEESQSETEDRKLTGTRDIHLTNECKLWLHSTDSNRTGKPKPIGNCPPKSPSANNLKLPVDKMTEQQLEQAIETISEDLTTITIVDNNSNENQIKTEIVEISNTNQTNNNKNQIRRSSKIRSNNPIVRFGNLLTH